MMRRFRAVIALLLGAVLVIGTAVPALAADTASGSTIRLEKTEGTVTVTTAAGVEKKIKDGGRLFSGYTVTTSGASYAYVSLDGSKMTKLDEYSQIKIQKSGRKLEVQLSYGEMFFDVSAPLARDESFTIRTASLVTGIHGTAGFAGVEKDGSREYIALLEGSVTVTGTDGKSGSVTITGGGRATMDKTGEGTEKQLRSGGYSWEDIPGFVAVEVAANEALQEKITEKTPELAEHLDEITENAGTRLAADQAKVEAIRAKHAEILAALEQQQNGLPVQNVDQMFTEPVSEAAPESPYCTIKVMFSGENHSNQYYEFCEPTVNDEQVDVDVEGIYRTIQVPRGGNFEFMVGASDVEDCTWFLNDEKLFVSVLEYGNGFENIPTGTDELTEREDVAYAFRISNVQTDMILQVERLITVKLELDQQYVGQLFAISDQTSNNVPVTLLEEEADSGFTYQLYHVRQGRDFCFRVGVDETTAEPEWYEVLGQNVSLCGTKFVFADGKDEEHTSTSTLSPEDCVFAIDDVQAYTVIHVCVVNDLPLPQ